MTGILVGPLIVGLRVGVRGVGERDLVGAHVFAGKRTVVGVAGTGAGDGTANIVGNKIMGAGPVGDLDATGGIPQ